MAAVLPSRPKFEVTPDDVLGAARRNTGLRVNYVAADLSVKQFLRALGKYREDLVFADISHFGWLLPFRNDFRNILRRRPCVGLREYLGVCPPTHPVFPIAVWLLGRSGSRQKNFDLDRLPVGDSVQARKHLSRALRQVEAWPRLRELAARFPEDKFLERMLAGGATRSFERRIARFAEHVDHSHQSEAAEASQMPLWIRDAEWTLSPPKPAGWIRTILERIRKWVRGE